MGKTVKQGAGPFAIFGITILTLVIVVLVFLGLKVLYPEALYNMVGGTPDEQLAKQNADLQSQVQSLQEQLHQSQNETGTVRAELFQEKTRKVAWAVLIGVLIIGAVLLWLIWKYLQRGRGLTIEEAELKYIPKARLRFGYDETRYPMVKKRPKSVERVKKKSDIDKDERMYFLEFEFVQAGEENRYLKGHTEPRSENVITVAILNMSDEMNQQWYPFKSMNGAMTEAHKVELWGFHMQKTRMEDDILAGLQSANSVKEVQEEYKEQSQEDEGR